MAAAKKSVTVVLGEPQEKKSVTRFDTEDENGALRTAYVSHDALKKIGNPKKIKVTIEAA